MTAANPFRPLPALGPGAFRKVPPLPFTIAFLLVALLANAAAGTLGGALPRGVLENWGISYQTLRDGEIYRLVTGVFLSHDLGMALRQAVFVAVVVGAYEWTEGTARTVAVFLGIEIIGAVLVLLPLPIQLTEIRAYDVGMSAGGFGLLGALFAKDRRGALAMCSVLVAISAKIALQFDVIADTLHVLCLLLGFGLQSCALRNSCRAQGPFSRAT